MKKLAPLLLIIIFITAQYGRVASYYHCLIVNVVQHDLATACDCEKVLSTNTGAEKNGPTQLQHIIQFSLDEYTLLLHQENNFNCPSAMQLKQATPGDRYTFSFKNSIAIPPEC